MKLKTDFFFKALLFLMAFMFTAVFAFGQKPITGTVSDSETGEPLIGANVLVKGTSAGTVTDIDGNYSLGIPEGGTILVFSYTGYTTMEFEITSMNVLDVQLTQGSVLDEVVVIGYGTVKREDATGAITSVSSEDFNRGALTSPQELLAGKVAGVQITTGNAPGDGAVIRIRGGSSILATNDPLIVVDGIPLESGGIAGTRNPLNIINPNDIETFTILKDASATAIYGSRASNGVIIITTKKGALGNKLKVNYTTNISSSSNIEQLDVLTADEFRTLINEQFTEGHPARDLLGNENTNWQDEVYQSAFGQDHNLAFSGGIGDVLPYRVSLGYTDKAGVLKTDEFKRTTIGVNLSPGLLDNKLQVNLSFKGMFEDNRFANRGAIGSAVSFDPTQPVLEANSPYGGYFTWLDGPTGNPNFLAPKNPLSLLELRNDLADVSRFITNVSIDYRLPFVDGLRANLNVGYDASTGEGTIVVPDFAPFAFNALTGGGVNSNYRQEKKNELIEFYLNYDKDFGASKLNIMGGYSWQRNFFENYSFNSDQAGTPTETTERTDSGELFLLSVYGRMNYSIQDKYIFTFTLRRDGSSRFSPDNRWGLFPSAAFAWKVLDNKAGAINNLKLRLGYGVTGQQEARGYYEYLPTYTFGQVNAAYQFGDEFVTTIRPEEYDEKIKWEETTTYNLGVDFGILENRINGSVEFYHRETKDLLNRIPIPAGTNLSNFITTNIGDLENRGVEVTLNAEVVNTSDLNWEVGVNFTKNKNEITKLTATDDPNYQGIPVGGISGGIGNTVQRHSVGHPANTFYVYEQVYDENGKPIEGLYVDRNGDGVVTPDDLYRTEKPIPDMFWGFNTRLSWKKLVLTLSGRANIGNYMYNNLAQDHAHYSRIYHSTNYLVNSHSVINEIGFQNQEALSDHFLHDASFMRIDFITLSYTLDNLFNKPNVVGLSLTVSNPVLVTDYQGLDPEIFGGIDGNIYPRSRTITFGLNASF